MKTFLYFAFVIVGGLLGAAMAGTGGMLVGGIAGLAIFHAISGAARTRATPSADAAGGASLADVRREVRRLEQEVARLKRRVELLAGGAVVPEDAGVAGSPDADRVAGGAGGVVAAWAAAPTAAHAAAATVEPRQTVADAAGEEVAEAMAAPGPAARADLKVPGWLDPVRNWLFSGNLLVRIGVVILFFGFAFLAKFAAEHAVLPLGARYGGIALAGAVALAIGWRLRYRRHEYAMAMQGLGVAVLYLATFAAFRLHGLLPAGATAVLLAATCALSVVLAVVQNARTLAVLGVSGGFLVPLLASAETGNHVILFSYYALLDAGIVAVAWFRAWRSLNVLGFLFTFGIASLWAAMDYRDQLFATTELFLVLFFLTYLVVALLYARRRKQEPAARLATVGGERIDYVDGTLVFGNPLAAFGMQYLLVRDMPHAGALSALVLGLIYLSLALALRSRRQDDFRLLVESFLALGVVFASLAIPLGLDARWTAASWAAEGAGIFRIGLRQRRPAARAFALLLQAGAALNLLISLHWTGADGLFGLASVVDGSALGAIFVGGALLLTAAMIRRDPASATSWERGLEPVVAIAGLAALDLVWPVLLDLKLSGIAIAVSGLATVWLALPCRHGPATWFGIGAQLAGGAMFASAVTTATGQPLLNSDWLGSVALCLAGMMSAWRLRDRGLPLSVASVLALLWGVCWWWQAGCQEIARHAAAPMLSLQIFFTAASALPLAMVGRRLNWPAMEASASLLVPALLAFGMIAWWEKAHPFADGGWLAWPIALLVAMSVLGRLQAGPVPRLLPVGQFALLLLAAGLGAWQGRWWLGELGGTASAWPLLGEIVVPLALLAATVDGRLLRRWSAAGPDGGYRLASIPLALGLWFWFVHANATSAGGLPPLPYVPIANPLDLASIAVLAVLHGWVRRPAAAWRCSRQGRVVLALTAFGGINAALLRALHHLAGVPFEAEALMRSTLVQASLSLFWAMLAFALMWTATRRRLRTLWLVGAGISAGVVAKLFLIDLAGIGTIERIVSFIGVGIVLLVIGYLAPVPPRSGDAP